MKKCKIALEKLKYRFQNKMFNVKNKLKRFNIRLLNTNVKIKRFITKHSFATLLKKYGYIILIFIFVCPFILYFPIKHYFDINIFQYFNAFFAIKNLPTWISGIASFAAVYVAVMKDKKQESLRIGANVFTSKKYGAFIELLNRRTSKGFVRCIGIAFITKTSEIDKWEIIPEFALENFVSDEWKMFRSVSADDVTKIILNDGSSDKRLQNIFNYINDYDLNSDDYYRKYKNSLKKESLLFGGYYLDFHMQTNDNADDFYVMVSLRDLLDDNLIVK
ncbi:hypothetical protein MOO46_07630 (plasmid) [Apilactobacillus apisilvae]|uniref:Uncharacterized protein n=1 Tax=Apilactobacillus apisilvae TaxID=2923364 RepID=A0ABY4PJT6_9LACO|nr:hypothetical protein [Apilactobacillus apisilvae]UQS85853.1 hypothetical protein MOO46_07630 [Apilactobacillus apisilvae]